MKQNFQGGKSEKQRKHLEKLRLLHIGKLAPPNFLNSSRNKGKNHSKETRKKMSEAKKNISFTTKEKMSLAQRGKNHWNWKGGISPIKLQVRKSFKYRQWRSDIFTRDNFICVLCNQKGGYLEADHYPKMFSIIFHQNNIKTLDEALFCEELWSLNNGRTLCRECHNKTKKGNLWIRR